MKAQKANQGLTQVSDNPFAGIEGVAQRASNAILPEEGQDMLDALEGKKKAAPRTAPAPASQKNFAPRADTPDYFTNETGAEVYKGMPDQDKDLGTYKPGTKAAARASAPAPAPAPAMQPAPPAPSASTADYADMLRRLDADDGHAGALDRYGEPATEGAADGIGHFFRTMPRPMARGFADSLGYASTVGQYGPAGLAKAAVVEAIQQYYKHSPSANFVADSPTVFDNVDTNQKDIRRLAGQIGINTNLPSEEGDTSNSSKWAESLGYAVGSAVPFMPGSVGMQVARAAPRAIPMVIAGGRQLAQDVGLSLFGGGMGRELAENVVGGKQGVGNPGEAVGPLVAGGAVAGAVTAVKLLATSGLLAMERSSSPVVSQLIKGGQMNAGELLRQTADDPAMAGAMARLGGGVQSGEGGLPAGFNVPPPTASLDLPSQALMHQVITKDALANSNYRAVLEANENLLKGAAPVGEGAEDVASHLANLQEQRLGAKQQLITQAVDQAEQDLSIATRGATYNPEETGAVRRAYELNLRGHLMEAWANSSATTRAEFEAARANGLDQATIPTTRLYDRLADMMSESINAGMAKSFPSSTVSELYNKPPLKMFDSHGVPVGNITENYTLGSTEPWARVQGLYNNIDNELSAAMRSRNPDPIKLQYLMRMQDEVTTTMRDMRMGGRFAPGSLPKGLENALRSAQENRALFVNSPVGKVLGFDSGAGPNLPSDSKSIRAWLANTPETTNRVQSMFDAVAGQSLGAGVNPLDALLQNMQGMLRQEFADSYRTGGLKTAGKWLENNDALLSHPSFEPLQKEFRTAVNSRDVAERMAGTGKTDLDEIRQSRAALFLNSKPEEAIANALKGPNKYTATRDLISDLQQDPTGRALQGFANMAFDRMIAHASNYTALTEPGKAFSGRAAEQYYLQNKGMFQALDGELPGYGKRVEQWVAGAKMQDRIMARPEGIPLSQKEIAFSLTGFGGIAARIAGARLGAALGTGTIQVPGYGAQYAYKVYEALTSKLPAERAQALITRAMIEPDVFATLMQPIADAAQAEKVGQLMQPYLMSAPSVIYNTGQQHANPQKPMGLEPPT